MKRKYLIAIFMLISLISFTACDFWPKEEKDLDSVRGANSAAVNSTVPSGIIKVKRGPISNNISIKGIVAAAKITDLSFSSRSGKLTKVNVSKDQNVNKGDIVAEMESNYLINEIKKQQLELERAQKQYDEVIKNNCSEAEMKEAEIDLEIEKLKLNSMEREYSKLRLLSPFSGKVIKVTDKAIGTGINVRETVAVIADMSQIYVECIMSESIANEVKCGTKTKITYKDKEYSGEIIDVVKVIPENDKSHNLPYIRIKTDNKDAPIGEEVDVAFQGSAKENAMLIPYKSIKVNGNDKIVYVIKDGKKLERKVVLGIINEEVAEVVNGLTEGEEILELQ